MYILANRNLFVPINHLCADTDNNTSEHTGPSHSRNTWGKPVLRKHTVKTCSGNSAALVARSDRPRIEAKSWTSSFRFKYSFGSRTALGAIKRTPSARLRDAVCGGLADQSC